MRNLFRVSAIEKTCKKPGRRGLRLLFKFLIYKNRELPPEQIKFLLQLIDILESPKAEGDKKIKELEKSIPEIFK
jgi:hypothetical protein